MKPLIKYVGGKQKVADQIIAKMLADVDDGSLGEGDYVEPFCGSAALFGALWTAGALDACGRIILADTNPSVVKLYRDVKDEREAKRLKAALWVLQQEYDRNGDDPEFRERIYKEHRDKWNEGQRTSARFVFLKQAGFNGLWRENAEGHMNVSWGKRKSLSFPDDVTINKWHDALQSVELVEGDFIATLERVYPPAAHVYLDPPYFGTFNRYTADTFTFSQHTSLLCWAEMLRRQGASVFYSNKHSDHLQKLMDVVFDTDYLRWPLELKRTVAQTGSEDADEILIGLEN